MPDFWYKRADSSEQGSFCDTDSGFTYNNQSSSDAREDARLRESNGDSVIDPFDSLSESSDSDRINSSVFDIDSKGYEYAPKLKPGE